MSICSTGFGDLGPLVVKPKVAWKMLACSNTRGYELQIVCYGSIPNFR